MDVKAVLRIACTKIDHISLLVSAQCHDIGGQRVKYDPSCDRGGVGCNAGGQGTRCRFARSTDTAEET